MLNPGAVFLRFVTKAFLLFLAPAGGSNPAGQSLTLNLPKATVKIRRNPAPGFNALVPDFLDTL